MCVWSKSSIRHICCKYSRILIQFKTIHMDVMRYVTTIQLSLHLLWPQTCHKMMACNREAGNYIKGDIMRAGSRVWSRCVLNGDVYGRQIGPLMRGGESQSSSSLRSITGRPVPCGEGQKWGSDEKDSFETKTLIHLSNSFFFSVFLNSTLFLCSDFCLQYATGIHSKKILVTSL